MQASSKVEIDADATERLQVCMADFLSALQNDCKPVSELNQPALHITYALLYGATNQQ